MSDKGKVFLFLGPEAGEKEQYIHALKERVGKEAGGDLESSRYYPFETGMSEVVSVIKNGSLFSSHKYVEIQQAETIKGQDAVLLGEYCLKPSPEATLVLVSSAGERDIAKPLVKSIPKDQIKVFWELFENKKHDWIRSFFRERKIRVDEDTVELILELVENNTQELRRECDKLALFFGQAEALSYDDVEQYLYHSKEENVFTLFDRFAAADLGAALEVLKKIGLSGDSQPVQIMGGLLWQFRRVLALSLLVEDHVPFDQACRTQKVFGKKMQQIYRQALGNYRSSDLERIIALAAKTDGLLREGPGESQDLLLEMFLYYSMEKKGRIPEPFRV
jgi:DNA polymerase-3 subunit delta